MHKSWFPTLAMLAFVAGGVVLVRAQGAAKLTTQDYLDIQQLQRRH